MWLLNQGDTEWVREGLPPPERGSQGSGTKIDVGPSVLGVMGGAAETYLALGECENAVICATADIDSKEHRLFGELRTMAFISLGRAKARLGRAEEAASAFQRAIEHAQLCHLRYFELIAHRDYIVHVLDPQGRRSDHLPALGACLRTLVLPPAAYWPILGEGMDPEEAAALAS